MMLAIGVPSRFKAAQSFGRRELRKDQHDQVIPSERLDPGIAAVTIDDCSELPAVEGFKQFGDDARPEAHAPDPVRF